MHAILFSQVSRANWSIRYAIYVTYPSDRISSAHHLLFSCWGTRAKPRLRCLQEAVWTWGRSRSSSLQGGDDPGPGMRSGCQPEYWEVNIYGFEGTLGFNVISFFCEFKISKCQRVWQMQKLLLRIWLLSMDHDVVIINGQSYDCFVRFSLYFVPPSMGFIRLAISSSLPCDYRNVKHGTDNLAKTVRIFFPSLHFSLFVWLPILHRFLA